MGLYTIKENSHKEMRDGKDEWVSDGFIDPKEISLLEIDKLGFHFTPQKNCAAISATGLKPKIGSNAKGDLGKSAVEKTYFSRHIDGAMQIFNRTINALGEIPLNALQKDDEKSLHLMVSQKSPLRSEENFSIIEAFEYARRYMGENRYFAFNLTEPQYERQIDENKIDAQVASINERLDEISGITLDSRYFTNEDIKELKEIVKSKISDFEEKTTMLNTYQASKKEKSKVIRKKTSFEKVEDMLESAKEGALLVSNPKTTINGIDRLIDELMTRKKEKSSEEGKESIDLLAKKVSKLRAELSIEIGRKSKKLVSEEILGEVKPDSLVGANSTRIDYNDEAISWVDFYKHPHNCHTLVLDIDMGISGITVPRGVRISASDVRLLSLDGKEPASSIDIIQFMYNKLPEERRKNYGMNVPSRKKDEVIIGSFLEYVDIYSKYIDSPSDFLEKISQLQECVAQEFPNFGKKVSAEDLKRFQAELIEERKKEVSERENVEQGTLEL